MSNQVTADNIGVTDAVECAVGCVSHSADSPPPPLPPPPPLWNQNIRITKQMKVGGQNNRSFWLQLE